MGGSQLVLSVGFLSGFAAPSGPLEVLGCGSPLELLIPPATFHFQSKRLGSFGGFLQAEQRGHP